jgi:hypothetical protein
VLANDHRYTSDQALGDRSYTLVINRTRVSLNSASALHSLKPISSLLIEVGNRPTGFLGFLGFLGFYESL